MQVPTTETILDRQREQKELMLEINKLKVEEEKVRREVSELIEAKTALQKEVIGGVKVSDLKDTVLSNLRQGLRKDIKNSSSVKDDLNKLIYERLEKSKDLLIQEKKLSESIENNSKQLREVNIELEKTKETKRNETRFLEKEIEKKNKELQELKKNNQIELEKMIKFQEEYNEKKSELMKQETRLANKASDLAIYEVRLRNKYLELMPGVEIVV